VSFRGLEMTDIGDVLQGGTCTIKGESAMNTYDSMISAYDQIRQAQDPESMTKQRTAGSGTFAAYEKQNAEEKRSSRRAKIKRYWALLWTCGQIGWRIRSTTQRESCSLLRGCIIVVRVHMIDTDQALVSLSGCPRPVP
jgi:alpha-ketoglutarate-dependent taurine dioxygenase